MGFCCQFDTSSLIRYWSKVYKEPPLMLGYLKVKVIYVLKWWERNCQASYPLCGCVAFSTYELIHRLIFVMPVTSRRESDVLLFGCSLYWCPCLWRKLLQGGLTDKTQHLAGFLFYFPFALASSKASSMFMYIILELISKSMLLNI